MCVCVQIYVYMCFKKWMDAYKHIFNPLLSTSYKNALFHLPTYAKALSYLPHIWKMEEAANKPNVLSLIKEKYQCPL